MRRFGNGFPSNQQIWVVALVILLECSQVFAAAHPKPEPLAQPGRGKIVLQLAPVSPIQIEMADDSKATIGPDLRETVANRLLNTGKYIIAEESAPIAVLRQPLASGKGTWVGSEEPAARLSMKITEFSFASGARGNRMFYGFNERIPLIENEFPLREAQFEPTWFDRTFDIQGQMPFDSVAGLDLGDGFDLYALVIGVRARYAEYDARLGVRLEVEKITGEREARDIGVETKGFFVDVAGSYYGYTGGIRLARRDAMTRALTQTMQATQAAIERSVAGARLTARVDDVTDTGLILIGTGRAANVLPGVRYQVLGDPARVLEVVSSQWEGSVAKAVSSPAADFKIGDRLIEIRPGDIASLSQGLRTRNFSSNHEDEQLPGELTPVLSDQIVLPWTNLQKVQGLDQEIGGFDWSDLVKMLVLPYRIWRYFQYDRAQLSQPDSTVKDPEWRKGEPARPDSTGPIQWAARARGWGSWARQVELPVPGSRATPGLDGSGVTVAVIDSGMDYNHPALFGSAVGAGPDGGVGFDAISDDTRAYDDGYHGTEIASLVLAVAPRATIYPVKVFNPHGITRSSALIAGFRAAIRAGARVIVAAWATRRDSAALRAAVAEAQAAGVLVVTAAGDRGDDLTREKAYPAVLRREYPNVLVVASLSAQGGLLQESGRFSNFGADVVEIAAPGSGLRVARPRREEAIVSSSGHAAALVAGAIARELQAAMATGSTDVYAARDRVLAHAATAVPLSGKIAASRSLRIPR